MTNEFQMHHAKLLTPAFERGQKQLHPVDVEIPRRLAPLRVQVKKVIGSLRKKYKILQHVLQMSTVSKTNGEAAMDQILLVCVALVNFCPSIINNRKL